MRILIIATVRTGGYNLCEWLSLELGYKMIHEPIRTNQFIGDDNIVVKVLINEIENNIEQINLSNWDKIIGLKRLNVSDAAESFLIAKETDVWHHKKYSIDKDWIIQNKNTIKDCKNRLEYSYQQLDSIKEIKLHITYEGIYETGKDIEKLKNYLGLVSINFEDLLNIKNKLRIK
jgi:hypothetical protein